MPKCRHLFWNILVLICVSACSPAGNSRYQDTTELERPPTVTVNKADSEAAAADQLEAPKRRHGKGLKSDVYKSEGSDTKFKIKRLYNESWLLVDQALQLHDLKIPDQDRSKGTYYVEFDNRGLLSKATSFLGSESKPATYLIKLDSVGDETEVSVSLAKSEEQADKSGSNDGTAATSDASENLSEIVFDSLQEEVKEE